MTDNRKAWTPDEDHAILTLVKKHGVHHWSEISRRMHDHFGAPGRTGKQCRQRWHNHLNPKINKQPWTSLEEQQLFEHHSIHGNKWKSIAQFFKGRTDNDIKNKFYSTMRKRLRKINKLLGVKNSTTQVKEIKPKVLSNIIAAASTENERVQQAWQDLSKILFCQDDKKISKLVKGQDRAKIQQLIDKINAVNQAYLQSRQNKQKYEDRQIQQNLQHSQQDQEDQDNENQHQKQKKQKQRIRIKVQQPIKVKVQQNYVFDRPRRTNTNSRKRQASPNSKTKQTKQSKQIKEKKEVKQQERQIDPEVGLFNFNMNLGDNFSPGLFYSAYSTMTPPMGRRVSMQSNQMQNMTNPWRDQFLNSPRMMTRSFIRTPNLPTPGSSLSPTFDFRINNYDLGNKESYNELVYGMQQKIKGQAQSRM